MEFVSRITPLLLIFSLMGGCATPTPPETPGGISDTPDLALSAIGEGGPGDLGAPPDLNLSCGASGAACNTGNPGACANGHQACVNNQVTCVPDATTQSCYSGPAGTAGHGVCKAGVQSCIGTLGACQGEVKPAAIESCFNDLDDDCNDVVNNGCPDTVTIGTPRTLGAVGGTGGHAVSGRCPAGSWVTRAQFLFDDPDSISTGVRVFCAKPTLVRGQSSYSITLTAVTPSPYTSFQGLNYTPTDDQNVDCGTSALTAGWATGGRSGLYVDGVGMTCGAGTITMSASNTLSYSFAKNGVGGYFGFSGGSPYEEPCAANEVLIGWDGRVGDFMDQIQPVCAPLVTTYK
jgi:hypothetical protein